jgi:quercetin dioxygenase-like cupin family protein
MAGVASALLALTLAACGTSAATAPDAERQADEFPPTTTVNGEKLPGKPVLTHSSEEILSLMRDGRSVRVYRDTRDAGTRSPIHVHPYGGWTCIVEGQAVFFLEGSDSIEAGPGECFEMPALTAMSNYNPGPGTTTMLDSFVSPEGANLWVPIEACLADLGHEFPTDGCDTP